MPVVALQFFREGGILDLVPLPVAAQTPQQTPQFPEVPHGLISSCL